MTGDVRLLDTSQPTQRWHAHSPPSVTSKALVYGWRDQTFLVKQTFLNYVLHVRGAHFDGRAANPWALSTQLKEFKQRSIVVLVYLI